MIKYSHSQGFAHAFLVIGLIVALLGALGFIFWQNFIHNETTVTKTETVTKPASEPEVDENKDYVVLQDWGIKFKRPAGRDDIKVYKLPAESNDMGFEDKYQFTTKRVEDFGEQCADSADGKAIRLATLDRTRTYSGEVTPGSVHLNDSKPFNGYYYFVSPAQSYCTTTDDPAGEAIQMEDRKLINEMLLELMEYKK